MTAARARLSHGLLVVLLVALAHETVRAREGADESLEQGTGPAAREVEDVDSGPGGSPDAAPRPKSHDTDSGAWWVGGDIGAHVTVPNAELSQTTGPVGVGLSVFGGAVIPKVPLVLGGALGGDTFIPVERAFTYGDYAAVWKLKRRSMWLGPAVRLMPPKGKLRPYLQALAGIWLHDVAIETREEYRFHQSHGLGMAVTGMYGFGAGLDLTFGRRQPYVGLYAHYLRGGRVSVPDHFSATVVDDVLHIGAREVGPIQQWMFGLSLGSWD